MIRGMIFSFLFGLSPALQAAPITYQGQLEQSGTAFSGNANLDFRLFDADSGGSQIGTTQERLNWPVMNGQFQVELDFGTGAFDGSERYLEIRINGALMNPRQAMRATPQALVAATTVAGAIGTDQINAAQIQRRVTGSCPSGQYVRSINQAGTVVCGAEQPAWRLGGNTGTDSSNDFIGTLDEQPLELRIQNVRAFRIEPGPLDVLLPAPFASNIISGFSQNEVFDGVWGATLAGGGASDRGPDFTFVGDRGPNRITSHYSTISGGVNNTAGEGILGLPELSAAATVSGGLSNTASGRGSVVSGGRLNTASGNSSSVTGGFSNLASGVSSNVIGGERNTASGLTSTVSGGSLNCAGGRYSWGGGRRAKVRPGSDSGLPGTACDGVIASGVAGDQGTFVWADSQDTDFVSTGSNQFLIRSRGGMGINTNAPATALDVRASATRANPFRVSSQNGEVRFSVASNGAVTINSLAGATDRAEVCTSRAGTLSRCGSSSRELKTEIVNIEAAGSLIASLRPVRYHWKDSGDADIGLIAEEVAEALPEIVHFDEAHRARGFRYDRLGPLLVAGFQEQTAANAERFAALEQDHQRLATENAELRAEVAVLKVQSGQMRELADRNAELEQRLAALESVLLDGGRLAGAVADESL